MAHIAGALLHCGAQREPSFCQSAIWQFCRILGMLRDGQTHGVHIRHALWGLKGHRRRRSEGLHCPSSPHEHCKEKEKGPNADPNV